MFLNLENLSKIFPSRDGMGAVRAVDSINLEIVKGEFLTLLGPSGCGKTTTLRLIAGFEFPSEGSIVLDGVEINEQPPNRRDMAMVFQSYAIFPHLNVFENIAYGLKIKKISGAPLRKQVGQALEMTELDRAGKSPAQSAFRRSAAAGGPGPRPGHAAQGAAL